jgi:hypothetical protein
MTFRPPRISIELAGDGVGMEWFDSRQLRVIARFHAFLVRRLAGAESACVGAAGDHGVDIRDLDAMTDSEVEAIRVREITHAGVLLDRRPAPYSLHGEGRPNRGKLYLRIPAGRQDELLDGIKAALAHFRADGHDIHNPYE